MSGPHFFYYWLSFTILILISAGVAAFWAFRAGLFKDQERARHLALWAEVPPGDESTDNQTPNPK